MVKPFNDAAFSQDVNAIGPVVETPFGYHIIQVLKRNPAGERSRDEVVKVMKNGKRQQAIFAYIADLKAKADIKDYRATR
jgi:peptidyl-prolyl cis-trans isomerase C